MTSTALGNKHVNPVKHAEHAQLNNKPRSEQCDSLKPARVNLFPDFRHDVHQGQRGNLLQLADADMRRDRGMAAISAPPLASRSQTSEIGCEAVDIAARHVPENTLHIGVYDQQFARLPFDQLAIVVNGGARAEPANQSYTAHAAIAGASARRYCPCSSAPRP